MKSLQAAVIGDPIAHSLSPKIHNFLLSKHNISGNYEAIQVAKNDLKSFVENAAKNNLSGFNVTIPHKEEIFKICDHVSKTASLTGAVNTVVLTADNKIFGHNSDSEGFFNNLRNSAPDFNPKNKISFVIGAGGAARAIVYALIKSGMKEIYITNRNKIRALELIKNFEKFSTNHKCRIHFLEKNDFEKKLNECDLLVNSTSLGMQGQEPLGLSLDNLNKNSLVYDIVYKPLMTDLLKSAQARGNKIITGLGMLIFQALVGFEFFFKQKPDEKFVKELFEIL